VEIEEIKQRRCIQHVGQLLILIAGAEKVHKTISEQVRAVLISRLNRCGRGSL